MYSVLAEIRAEYNYEMIFCDMEEHLSNPWQ